MLIHLHLALNALVNKMKTICVHLPFGSLYVSEEKNRIVRISCEAFEVTEGSELLNEAEKQLKEYSEGVRKEFDLPLELKGTKFQMAVWNAMQKIEYGTCVSYQKLAQMAGFPDAVRAAGTACGKNPIAVIVPCHRVIKSDGKTGNYAWGEEMKQFLIDLEKKEK